jgi:hypothetical protein
MGGESEVKMQLFDLFVGVDVDESVTNSAPTVCLATTADVQFRTVSGLKQTVVEGTHLVHQAIDDGSAP